MTRRLLAFDGRMGASGDMLLAALLAAGADRAALEPVERALDVEYRIGRTSKCGIHATTVDVVIPTSSSQDAHIEAPRHDDVERGDEYKDDGVHGQGSESEVAGDHHGDDHGHAHGHRNDHDHDHTADNSHDHYHDHSHGDGHDHTADNSHDHYHDHTADNSHDHGHGNGHYHHHDHSHGDDHDHHHDHEADGHVHAEGHGPHRSYLEVCDIVRNMGLEEPVEADALAIFERLGEAEAAVHGTDIESIHFHEVGADDAIADVVGTVLLIHDLEVDRVVTTPISAGGGTVSMSHGEYPIPAPAVLDIVKRADWELSGGPVEAELLTPTGAAILAHVAEGIETLPTMNVENAGYGAGGYDLDPHPNVLRALVGTTRGTLQREDIAVLETNLDDATPEVLGGLQETLSDAGARDVSIGPVTMKKSRPGHLVKVICRPADRERVARRLAEETGTLGIRDAGVTHRWIARRGFETVSLEVGGDAYEVTVKVASDEAGDVYDASAEYDDAAAVAAETGEPIQSVVARAERAFWAERSS
ncbi:nickel pincer cofactor biosynthesis protein LarC [Natronosalvus halobius]|uniref:nickel pincer cofactor biosynthesis protein LarC n=1 Tax=Natronosalvus halobius TaxID=2953746 RepID=UPI0020A19532|nr:nickel pincer cofactor biosynthesis protein LarC [Natronosalvus halobius]USZ72620.1 nickel pincer cofactor biosynthesis protein LarC [Natronosalvus halobius]